MSRFLNLLILLSIVLSTIVTFIAGGKQTVIFNYFSLDAGFVTLLALGLARAIVIDPFKPKFYRRETLFFSYKVPLLRPEAIVFYFTLLILYIPQVSKSINLKYGDAAIGLVDIFLIVVYCIYTWSVLVVDIIKQNQLTLLENTILSFMKEFNLYDKNASIDHNLAHFTHNINNSFTVDLPPVLKSTNQNVHTLDEYKKTLAIAKQKSPEELSAVWDELLF